jgi:hypothetical protein
MTQTGLLFLLFTVLTATDDPYYDPIAGYAIVFQLLPKVDDYAPDLSDKLRLVLNQVSQLAGSATSQVQDAIAATQGADAEGGKGVRTRTKEHGWTQIKPTEQKSLKATKNHGPVLQIYCTYSRAPDWLAVPAIVTTTGWGPEGVPEGITT